MTIPTRQEVQLRHQLFLTMVALCVTAIVVVHVLPKNPQPRDSRRFLYTLVYFGAWQGLCLALLRPRERFLQAYYRWRYEDAPPSLERLWGRYLFSLNQMIGLYATIVGAFVISTGLATLAHWYPNLQRVSLLYNAGWWLSVVAFALAPFMGGFLFQELGQRWRMLSEQLSLMPDYQPRNLLDLYGPFRSDAPVQLKLHDDGAFSAAGLRWTWPLLYGNTVIFGQPGSGKTSCVLTSMLEGLFGGGARLALPPAALILDPKGDFFERVQALCQRYGRTQDLVVLDPERPERSIRWNPFDTGDDELELAGRFAAVLENLGMRGGDSSFWIDSARKILRHGLALLRLTNPGGEPPNFRQIHRLASSLQCVQDRLEQVRSTCARAEECLVFFTNEWAQLPDETRICIQAHLTNMIDPFLMEPYLGQFSGRSDCRIEQMIEQGKILYVNMPLGCKEMMARTVSVLLKLEYFRAVLRGVDKARPSFFLCDEFQTFFTAAQGRSDADFFERCRQSRHVNLVATQNLPTLQKNSPRPEAVTSLLGLCCNKIFLNNTENETNQYAANLFGQQLVAMGSTSGSLEGRRGRSWGQAGGSSDQYDHVFRPERFTELAMPGDQQAIPYCEAIVFRTGPGIPAGQRARVKWARHLIEKGPSHDDAAVPHPGDLHRGLLLPAADVS